MLASSYVTFLERMGFKVLQGWGAGEREVDPATVPWKELSASRFPYRLRHAPGPLNSLGRVKFMFPNAFNVYLHDTPARELFGKAARALSSGCIRVERPMELAGWVFTADPTWNAARIREVIDAGTETIARLATPVPVHLLYWTAWVDETGTLQFREDLYGRDARVRDALRRAPPGLPGGGTR